MTAKVKSVLTVASEVVETAAGYAIIAVGLYAALFVDVTGNGSLWKSMHAISETSTESVSSPNATRVVKVPVQAVVTKDYEDRMLAVFDDAPPATEIAAVYPAPEKSGQRPSAAFTDSPADPKSGKSWKKGIKGELRNFTVYGQGEQASASSMKSGAYLPEAHEPDLTLVSAPGSAARSETASAARPGMGSRLSRGALSASETSRNVR